MKQPTRLNQPGHVYARYTQFVDPGTSFEDVLEPDYWAHVVTRLRPMDVIEVVALDGSFDAELRVMSIKENIPTFRVLRECHVREAEDTSQPDASDRYETRHFGRGVWGVVERSSGSRVWEGGTKDEAGAERLRLEAARKAA